MIFLFLLIMGLSSANEITKSEIDLLLSFKNNPNLHDYYLLEELMQSDFDSDIESHSLMYFFCLYNDDVSCANIHLNKAIALDPKNKELREQSKTLQEYSDLISRAKKTSEKELYDEALRDYTYIISSHPEKALPYYDIGIVYLKKTDYDNAVINFRKAIELNPFKEAYESAVVSVAQRIAKEAGEAARRQDFNAAIPKYKAAIKYHPEFTEALFNLSKIFYILEEFESAKLYLDQSLSVNNSQAQALKMLADIYRKERNPTEAIKFYEKAIEVKPNYYQSYYSLGSLLIKSDIRSAKEKLLKVVSIKPEYYKAHETLGIVNMELNLYGEALENFSTTIQLLEKKPPRKRSYKAFYLSSQIYLCFGDFNKAKEYAKGALDIRSNCAPAYLYLGIAEKNMNNRPAAMDAFNSARADKDWRESADFEIKNYDDDTSLNIGCNN